MPFEPAGIRFFDAVRQREMLLVADGEPYAGWICYRHPDGQWVTFRKATPEDIEALAEATPTPESTL